MQIPLNIYKAYKGVNTKAILLIVLGILLILFTTFDDNSVRYITCENTNIVRYDVVENFSKNKKGR